MWATAVGLCGVAPVVLALYLRKREVKSKLLLNPKDTRMKKIIKDCKGALHETYRAPWWCCNSWLNVAVMLFKQKWQKGSLPLLRRSIDRPDGGLVSVDYAMDEVTQSLPSDAPVLGILHTISGSSWDHAGFMLYAANRGWRSCVLNRRGHSGMPLRVPSFSILGNVDDTVAMVENIRENHPNSFIALAGISAGSGQVVSYIGREGSKTPIGAAASLCPAWDIRKSWHILRDLYPKIDSYLARLVRSYFIEKDHNAPALASMPDAVADTRRAQTFDEFMQAAVPFAGCSSMEQYYKENNPMEFVLGNKTPTLVLNALDDFLCVKENINLDLLDQGFNYALMVTDEGSHIGFTEGTWGQGNFMWRVSIDFFDAVREETRVLVDS